MKKCEHCKRLIRGEPVVLFSGSLSGASTTTILCPHCAKNPSVMTREKAKNDWILDKMDGEDSRG